MADFLSNAPLLLKSGCRAYVIATGAGAGLQKALWDVPGASSFLAGAEFPYAPDATDRILGYTPDSYCSPTTAIGLAMEAYSRAFVPGGGAPVGVGMSSSVATLREHRGDHRICVASVSDSEVRTWSRVLTKGSGPGKRLEDGLICDSLGLHALLEGARVPHDPGPVRAIPGYLPVYGDATSLYHMDSSDVAMRLLLERPFLTASGRKEEAPSNGNGLTLLPGAFNPPHEGHLWLAKEHAAIFHLTVDPPHKEALSVAQVLRRLKLLEGRDRIVTSGDPLFLDKARRFPGARFLIGADAFSRMLDPAWGPSIVSMLAEFRLLGVKFLVADREVGGSLLSLPDILATNPAIPAHICQRVLRPAQHLGMSSTALREAAQ